MGISNINKYKSSLNKIKSVWYKKKEYIGLLNINMYYAQVLEIAIFTGFVLNSVQTFLIVIAWTI